MRILQRLALKYAAQSKLRYKFLTFSHSGLSASFPSLEIQQLTATLSHDVRYPAGVKKSQKRRELGHVKEGGEGGGERMVIDDWHTRLAGTNAWE